MEKIIGKTAAILALTVFFIMAAAGLCAGLSPAACGRRCAAGAAAMYITVKIAGRLLTWAVVEAMTQTRLQQEKTKNMPFRAVNSRE